MTNTLKLFAEGALAGLASIVFILQILKGLEQMPLNPEQIPVFWVGSAILAGVIRLLLEKRQLS